MTLVFLIAVDTILDGMHHDKFNDTRREVGMNLMYWSKDSTVTRQSQLSIWRLYKVAGLILCAGIIIWNVTIDAAAADTYRTL